MKHHIGVNINLKTSKFSSINSASPYILYYSLGFYTELLLHQCSFNFIIKEYESFLRHNLIHLCCPWKQEIQTKQICRKHLYCKVHLSETGSFNWTDLWLPHSCHFVRNQFTTHEMQHCILKQISDWEKHWSLATSNFKRCFCWRFIWELKQSSIIVYTYTHIHQILHSDNPIHWWALWRQDCI